MFNIFKEKLKKGLEKTKTSFGDKLDSVLKVFKKIDDDLYDELEEALIMADAGVETSMYIIDELKKKVKENHLTEADEVRGAIKEIIADILSENDNEVKLSGSLAVVMVIGVNGVGKTTSIGKMASLFKSEGKKVILGAGDTFRAAAVDQLQVWAERVGVDIIKHQEGADPGAVMFDSISAAKARGADVLIFDTAGRLHNKKNLMDELGKISRVVVREMPDALYLNYIVLDATTGQNALSQVDVFNEVVDIDGIILTKLDGTAKGGVVFAITNELEVPVVYVGVGEGIDDLEPFDPESFVDEILA